MPLNAARLIGASQAVAGEVGVSHLAHHIQYERALITTRSQLAERAFLAEWDSGQALSLEQAVAEAKTVIENMAMLSYPSEPKERAAAVAAGDAGHSEETKTATNVVRLRPRSRSPRRA
jgi:hypothetical protein